MREQLLIPELCFRLFRNLCLLYVLIFISNYSRWPRRPYRTFSRTANESMKASVRPTTRKVCIACFCYERPGCTRTCTVRVRVRVRVLYPCPASHNGAGDTTTRSKCSIYMYQTLYNSIHIIQYVRLYPGPT